MNDEPTKTEGIAPGESDGNSVGSHSPQGTRRVAALPDLDLPTEPDEAADVLAAALIDARKESEDRLEDLQRVAAEFENYRKRAERERGEIVERSTQRLIEALLPVLDSFDGAFAHEAQTSGEELLQKGITSTFHQLMEILEREGLAPIPAEGHPFDPAVHEAVTGAAGEDLMVTAEMRRGYTLRGRVIRAAMVAVAPIQDEEENVEQ